MLRSLFSPLVAVSFCWFLFSSMWIYPHSLSFFNESIGGPQNGPKHLLGSNVDWGQDLYALDRVLDLHPEWGPVAIFNSGFYSPEAFGIRAIVENSYEPLGSFSEYEYIAVSVNALAGEIEGIGRFTHSSPYDRPLIEKLREQRPISHVGYSILIFDTESLFQDSNG